MKKMPVLIFAFIFAAAFMLVSCGGDDNGPQAVVEKDPLENIDIGPIDDNLVKYPWPTGMTKFTNVAMAAGGQRIDLYSVRANNTYNFNVNAERLCDQIPVAMFDMKEGTIDVVIGVSAVYNQTGSSTVAVAELKDVIIRPLSSNITPTVNGNIIRFSLTEPGKYSVEYNNVPTRPRNALLIFANEYEDFSAIEESPTAAIITKVEDFNSIKGGTTVLVMEPGVYVIDFAIALGRDVTLYLKPGAVVRGKVDMIGSGSKIVGRGIIDGSHLRDHITLIDGTVILIEGHERNNLEIRGITLFDPNAWGIQMKAVSGLIIDNLKIVSSRCNSDGISLQSSENITITNSFVRSWDDSVVVKNYATTGYSNNILVKDCILWTDLAQCMEIGMETNKGELDDPRIHDVTFEDILIFHAMHKPVISIHNADNAAIYDILFKNITVENYQPSGWNYLIDFTNLRGATLGSAEWTTVEERGSISGVTVENVWVLSGKTPGARFDSRQGGSITDITIKDVFFGETKTKLSAPPDGFGNPPNPNDGSITITWQ